MKWNVRNALSLVLVPTILCAVTEMCHTSALDSSYKQNNHRSQPYMNLRQLFKNPDTKYRPVPFWSWNDRLEDSELIRQIREMRKQGLGGYFMHARVGLKTPYLSEDWMHRTRACILEGKRLGMGAWLYDEDKWPSGFAGGIVPKMGTQFRQKALVCSVDKELLDNVVLLKKIQQDGKTLYFYCWTAPLGEPWFNNTNYVDLMNPEVVKAFLNSTHEEYYKWFSKYFGSTVPGVFTDEPCFLMWNTTPHPSVPWTPEFPRKFKERYGYDVLDNVQSLFYNVGRFEQVRYDFWRLASEMFLEAFGKQIFDWCEKHHLVFTGHYMAEDNLPYQMEWQGGAMPYYEYMHYPGIDHLSRNIYDALTVKQVSSVADQLGKERVLSETYGCSGWNLTFEGQKWISEWQIALGINLINPHLSLYSSRGERKRDYPPSLHYQQPWWNQYRIINDHLSRLCAVLSQGERVCDILLIHPMESAWVTFTPQDESEAKRLSDSLVQLVERLLSWQRDFHLGNESIMERHGRVADGKLWIGRAGYSVVLIPSSVTMRQSTVNLLREFIEAGGKVLFVGQMPTLVEGRKSQELAGITGEVVQVGKLRAALDAVLPANVVVRGENSESIYYHRRKIGQSDVLLLVNISQEKDVTGELLVRAEMGKWEEWNPTNGKITPIASSYENGVHRLALSFAPTESHLLVLTRYAKATTARKGGAKGAIQKDTLSLDSDWEAKALSPNALTLDFCRYRLVNGEWSSVEPIYKAHQFAMRNKGREIELDFMLKVESLPSKREQLYLVMERPKEFAVELNGKKILSKDVGWWTDISFRKIAITGKVKQGENHIVFRMTVKEDTELESIYLIGTFGVKNMGNKEFALVKLEKKVGIGDLVSAGYPFFSGCVRYKKAFALEKRPKRVMFELEKLDAVVLNLTVNGEKAGTLTWRPLCLDVTRFVKKGRNTIEIELVSSCRNLLGPHHHKAGELLSVHPGSWSDKKNWTDEYHFVPFGLTTAPKVVLIGLK